MNCLNSSESSAIKLIMTFSSAVSCSTRAFCLEFASEEGDGDTTSSHHRVSPSIQRLSTALKLLLHGWMEQGGLRGSD
jgi:hypothetical protein